MTRERTRSMTDDKLRHWERAHINGWLAEVTADPEGGFIYNARKRFIPGASWSGHADDLETAQRLADERAECRGCKCRVWRAVGAL